MICFWFNWFLQNDFNYVVVSSIYNICVLYCYDGHVIAPSMYELKFIIVVYGDCLVCNVCVRNVCLCWALFCSKLDFCLNFMVCTGDIQLQDTLTVRRHSWIVVKVTPGANNIMLHLSLYSSYCTYRDTAPTSLSTSRHIEIDHGNYTYSVLSTNTFLYTYS